MAKCKKCFEPAECCTDYCPNIQADTAAEMFGDYQVASDAGYEEIKCKDCRYMTYDCKDCMKFLYGDCKGEFADDDSEGGLISED